MPDITASFNFLVRSPRYENEKPYTITPSAERTDIEESARSNIEMERHDGIKITDIRDFKSDINMDTHGFRVLPHVTKYPRLDKLAYCKGYKKETAELLERAFGAELVITWDLRRRHVLEYQKGVKWDYNDMRSTEGPAIMAHIDYTFDAGLAAINAYLTTEQKMKFLNDKYRVRLISTWRPMVPVIEDHPLALCDPRSVKTDDMTACDRILGDNLGEVYFLHYQPDQKWYWLEHQTPSELYAILMWDSEASGQARCMRSFALPPKANH
ncbi:hypothetical protein GGS26DRAFT_425865 [Hypomontagnella submonticulosa]|nr:hypothetical protein GGS26DRAFT_425865 [Hypomontagnella submonticulosa]